ncbi:MAG: anhydro-N-acetylmuramic acid kinase [Pseudomonadota bacterium]
MLYVGLISGTSADAIDAALVEIDGDAIQTVATHSHAFAPELGARLAGALATPATLTAQACGSLDAALGSAFAAAARTVIDKAGVDTDAVRAIGSHGQTLFHAPDGPEAFTLQVGDPARIAMATGITTVADFRRADVAAGGQGAPLAPLLHDALLGGSDVHRAVLNLGGIANLSLLQPGLPVRGFDTGPANTLMDQWAALTGNGSHDASGALAARGTVDAALLDTLGDDPYFSLPAPKSTGREHFDRDWLLSRVGVTAQGASELKTERVADIMATLCALTVTTVTAALHRAAGETVAQGFELIACGGGCHNPELMRRLAQADGVSRLATTADFGIDPDYVEATLFAWLAAQRIAGQPVDTRTITGARHRVMAGSVYEPSVE